MNSSKDLMLYDFCFKCKNNSVCDYSNNYWFNCAYVKKIGKNLLKYETENKSLTRCVECGENTNHSILDVFVCEKCYNYELSNKNNVYNNEITPLGKCILDCSIEYSQYLMICKSCERFYHCKIHHCLVKEGPVVFIEVEK